ncbi:MAG: Stp1/IreP family PP2C-type Ser/Thr phosphatase [Oscillospiraceae bacterium]|nr:Stp1/IreP family PP2C-type Ser/Thr phosphatase [Candidatus Equicaccousia limihippi]
MQILACTDKGRLREKNEDFFAYDTLDDNNAYMILCDGMGGRTGGEIASHCAVDSIVASFKRSLVKNLPSNTIRHLLESVSVTANQAVYDLSDSDAELKGMGTTLVTAIISGNNLHIAHAGDSRAYLIRGNDIIQLTVDHSVVQTLIDKGELTTEQAKVHPRKNIITRALGVYDNIDIDLNEASLLKDDIIILCSDGLSNCVSSPEMVEIFKNNEFDQAVPLLIGKANDAGGPDNITVVAAKI